jgi:hypothetical protein
MRALRDHGPAGVENRGFICAMYALRCWTNGDGFAYPGLRTWASGARMSVNTLRKHIDRAKAAGWLGVETQTRAASGQGWKVNLYRCAIPEDIELPTEKDEMLADAVASEYGDVGGVSPMTDTPSSKPNGHGVSAMGDTPYKENPSGLGPVLAEGVSNGDTRCVDSTSKVYQNDPEGVSTIGDTESCLRTPIRTPPAEGATRASRRSAPVSGDGLGKKLRKPGLTGAERIAAATKLASVSDIGTAVKQYKLDESETAEVRRGIAQ